MTTCSKCGITATKTNPIELQDDVPVCANCWCASEPLVVVDLGRWAIFYGDDDAPLEVYLVFAEDKDHAIEQFNSEYPDVTPQFVMVEV